MCDSELKKNYENFKILSAAAVKDRTYAADVKSEGGDPDAVISVPNLDEDAIKNWWVEFKDNKENVWHTTDSNCSTIVAKSYFLLEEVAECMNSGGTLASTPHIFTAASGRQAE